MALRTNVRIVDRDRGFRRFMRALGEQYSLTVGVHADEGSKAYGNGATLAEVATIHEFGLGANPERSFMRSTLEQEREAILATMRKAARGVIARKLAPKQAHELVGEDIVRRVQQRIRGRIPPPLAPATLVRKRRNGKEGDVPLIDEGRLINSIAQRVRRTK